MITVKYKYTGKGTISFRAAASAKQPEIKKVYMVNEGKEVEVPVEIDHPQLEKISDKKTKKEGEE